ncbi:MAG: PQQ-binding-like beta-propeller repeat protein, partial [Thermoplasmatales archaeon]|nr:PQQ-binding-like beta-propeller repeat protein [Thermoplasmatales archaeon]
DRSIHTLSGQNGNEIWKYDTHEGGDGGWVYQVNCSYDYNGDGVIDVLAAAGGTATGARKAYCLDGKDGTKIWDCPLGSPKGPGFSIIGIEDFTGDGQPDVLAGASNSGESIGYAYGINGATGSITWTFTAGGSSVWALEQIDDITGDGIKDVIIGDSFTGNIYGLDATTGDVQYSNSIGSAGITRFAKLNDVNGDGHPDIVPAHSTLHVTQVIDGQTGSLIWTHPVADQPWNVARTADISGDGIDDVLVGTLYNNNYCYFLDGTDGSELCSKNYYAAVDAIMAIPDVVNDGSMEMVAGGRNGKVTCFSGGIVNEPPEAPSIDGPTIGAVGIEYEYSFYTTDPDEDDVYYYIEWGDGQVEEWIGSYNSGEIATVNHTWTSPDDYEIRAKAKDTNDAESEWSDVYPVTIVENEPPTAPTIVGPATGNAGTSYPYTFTSTDPDGDQVSYYIKWDDGSITDWTAFQASGPPGYSESHKWDEQGTYTIEAKAKDTYGVESDWATLEVTMPRNRAINTPFLNFLQNRPHMFPILQLLLQRLGLQ